ncbi:methyltransferase domain-containing protein [Dactylosporangium sp. CA-092794]|uniref:methyltransferase domain-containing protein n=1 Tax=Dactylosporangium sp. CA-092794 TaxID=3239929 RepID=UPI003D94BF42
MSGDAGDSRAPGAAGPPKAFTSYDVQMSLYDRSRVELFARALRAVVRPGAVVADCGSGTGILGMIAAREGAARVYCVEQSAEYVDILTENVRRNDLTDRIAIIHADAARVELPERVDVIVAEVLSAGFFYEPQLQIMNNVRRFLRSGGKMVPRRVDNFVELIEAQEDMYGFTFTAEPRWKALDDLALTDRVSYLRTDFDVHNSVEIAAEVVTTGRRAGRANALRISYEIGLAPGVIGATPTEFLLNPQIIFLDEPVDVRVGQRVVVALRYEAGSNPRFCKIILS